MAARLTKAQHAQFGPLAYALSLELGYTAQQIATDIGNRYGLTLNEKAVRNLIGEQIARFAEQNGTQVDQARMIHEVRQQFVIEQCKEALGSETADHSERVAYLRLYSKAADAVARANGVFVERVDIHQQTEVLVRKYIGVDISLV